MKNYSGKGMHLVSLLILVPLYLKAQDTSSKFELAGYIDVYYAYDFNKPSGHNLPGFVYSHNRHNEFAVNLGFLKAGYNKSRIRGNLAIGVGTYMNANYFNEPAGFKNVYEANIGLKISPSSDLWLDAGIMPSHIGFESAISKDCWVVTRCILADNSPYYEGGIRLTFITKNGKWLTSANLLNGWQRIKRIEGSSLINFGLQCQYKPRPGILFNYSNFYGTDKPDSAGKFRLFHNLYGVLNISKSVGITVGFDLGTEQISFGSSKKNMWWAPVFLFRHIFNEKWTVAGRYEYYRDANGVILNSGSMKGFRTSGISFNIDHSPFAKTVCRLELKKFKSRDAIFLNAKSIPSKSEFILTSSIAISF